MTNTATQIKEIKRKISKLENDFKRGVAPYTGFTINVCYGGNKQVDIERFEVGTISNPEGDSKLFYDFILNSLRGSLKFWEDIAKREIEELYDSLK